MLDPRHRVLARQSSCQTLQFRIRVLPNPPTTTRVSNDVPRARARRRAPDFHRSMVLRQRLWRDAPWLPSMNAAGVGLLSNAPQSLAQRARLLTKVLGKGGEAHVGAIAEDPVRGRCYPTAPVARFLKLFSLSCQRGVLVNAESNSECGVSRETGSMVFLTNPRWVAV